MIKFAENVNINKRLAKLKNRKPVVLGRSRRQLWRPKNTPYTIRKESETEPGNCVSIYQIVSAQPGRIPQIYGYLTNMRIWGATVFVDRVSYYTHVELMRDLTFDKALLAKNWLKGLQMT